MFFYSEPEIVTGDSWNLQLKQTWEPNDIDYKSTGELMWSPADPGNASNYDYQVADHTGLPNPTTVGGEKCLFLNVHHLRYHTSMLVWNRADLVGTSDFTAVSVRVLVYDIYSHGGWFLHTRATTTQGSSYMFGQTSGGTLSGPTGVIEGGVFDAWRRYRLDMIPQVENGVVTGDLLRGYVAEVTPGEPNWQLKMEHLVTSRISSANKYHGLQINDYAPDFPRKIAYFDDFEIYTSTDLNNL